MHQDFASAAARRRWRLPLLIFATLGIAAVAWAFFTRSGTPVLRISALLLLVVLLAGEALVSEARLKRFLLTSVMVALVLLMCLLFFLAATTQVHTLLPGS